MKNLIAAATLFAACVNAMAQATPAESSIRELSRCDSTFFLGLARDRATLTQYADLGTHRESAYFKVPEQRHPTESRVVFRTPMKIAGVEIVGYFDEIQEIPGPALIYSWGYLVSSTVPVASKALAPFIWDANRLQDEGVVMVRSEVWTHARREQGWTKVKTEPGLPKPGTVERVLLIEPYDDETRFIRFGCSIQGAVTKEMLREIRPDLGRYE
jgi:hypothetical protein